jgi:hypothetical protein
MLRVSWRLGCQERGPLKIVQESTVDALFQSTDANGAAT